jgi:translation initiation factor 1
MSNKHREKTGGFVYSTNPDFLHDRDETSPAAGTLPPARQELRVTIDSRQRAGKVVTIVRGFAGTDDDLKTLARDLKARCGVGGTVKEGDIIVQGDFRDKILAILRADGYRAR